VGRARLIQFLFDQILFFLLLLTVPLSTPRPRFVRPALLFVPAQPPPFAATKRVVIAVRQACQEAQGEEAKHNGRMVLVRQVLGRHCRIGAAKHVAENLNEATGASAILLHKQNRAKKKKKRKTFSENGQVKPSIHALC
jgi:hypothetical protein